MLSGALFQRAGVVGRLWGAFAFAALCGVASLLLPALAPVSLASLGGDGAGGD